MANKSSTSLYETLDGINYNSGYSQASANTIASGVQDDIVGRIQNIPNGGVFDLNKAAATFTKTHNREIISDLSLSDRQDVYFALKREIWAPLYESSDETTFNLMKGYTGAYLYSQYEWFNPGEDFNAHELAVLQTGSAVYQLMDFVIGDDSIHEAFTDWWEQGVGLNIAYWEALGRIPDAVKGKHVSIQLRDAGIRVVAGYDPITGELYVYSEYVPIPQSIQQNPNKPFWVWAANRDNHLEVHIEDAPHGGWEVDGIWVMPRWPFMILDFGSILAGPGEADSISVSGSGPGGSYSGTISYSLEHILDITFNGGDTFIYDGINYIINPGTITIRFGGNTNSFPSVSHLITPVP